jgi:hypothetical protein
MNLEQIAERIALPSSCLGSEIPALKELTEKYPFAQVFSILYLKALSNQQDVGFDEALQKHAYKITDRMKLYDLIHPTETVENENTPLIESFPQIESESIEILGDTENEIPTVHPQEVEDVSVNSMPETANSVIEHTTTVIDVEPISEVQEEKESATLAEESKETKNQTHLNVSDLNLEIISEVVTAVYHENLENSIPTIEKEEKISEQPEIELSTPEPVTLDTKKSFTSWLKMGQQSAIKLTPNLIEDDSEEIKIIEKQIDSIINKFIETEPSISRPKKEFYSPTKKAKESINPDGLIYSETLANILAIQGNFSKAIVAYEQLMLTNPEKKIFFAKRIEELKEKLKS